MLDLGGMGRDLFGLSPLAIQERHDEAFDVEAVTHEFYNEYKDIFKNLQNDLLEQTGDLNWAHDYALQFLNRCMFLYFIQRKGWLGEDREFLRTFWEAYKKAAQPPDSFVNRWIKVLFFEAFNRKFHGGHRHFPEKIRNTLSRAPFLNGGLFSENELDTKHEFLITDSRFEEVFQFLERYNFTIAEDSPLDQEVAVDPEVIGKVYESLVNISEEADERGDAGIFYTPRTEIDLMCRLSLVDHLSHHFGDENRSLLYQLVFALEPDEKNDADKAFSRANLWPTLNRHLREITVLDPACGSGSFLVGMLHILDDLQERAHRHLNIKETPYERKKQIIGQSLYGVDVMDWACHVAELRLWLALVVDAELTVEELHLRREPLLPHFTFKIRCGDSLVQEVGGINFGHLRQGWDIPKEIQARITKLKTEKLKFYNNDPGCQFKSADQVKREELRLFQDILEIRRHKIQEEIKALRRKIEGPIQRQMRLDGKIEGKPRQIEQEAVKWQKQVEVLSAELTRIDSLRESLKPKAEIPFVWDIAFVEIFESEKGGFDIVIGNPPYVRQENISDPRLPREKVTTENKKEYKSKLARSVYQAFPNFFGYRPETDTATHKLDAKSDLYIYFYFHGLSLLNPKGAFCFITSNSWLDVGYGRDLQEFLLRHCHIKMVLDNQARRSFAQADVNTVIVLFSAPDDRRDWALDRTVRFVMFKVPFEHILSPIIFDEVEATNDRKVTPEYRVYPVLQKTLLEDGWEWPEDAGEEAKRRSGFTLKGSKYGGNKWGGKYLRAPDIFFTIMEKGKEKLVRLGDITDVNEGRPTGANSFFYLTKQTAKFFRIEPHFLRPGLMKTRGFNLFVIPPSVIDRYFLVIDLPRKQLIGTSVLRYIEEGEKQNLHCRNTFSNKPEWYRFKARRPAELLSPCGFGATFFCSINEAKAISSNSFTEFRLKSTIDLLPLWAILNSAVTWLQLELIGRSSLGGGLLKVDPIEYRQLYVPRPMFLNPFIDQIKETLKLLVKRNVKTIFEEIHQSDRQILDEVIFDVLGLTQGERISVYEAVINLVEARLKKASSLDPKDRQKIKNFKLL